MINKKIEFSIDCGQHTGVIIDRILTNKLIPAHHIVDAGTYRWVGAREEKCTAYLVKLENGVIVTVFPEDIIKILDE